VGFFDVSSVVIQVSGCIEAFTITSQSEAKRVWLGFDRAAGGLFKGCLEFMPANPYIFANDIVA
jgi:hypothetical protein